MPDARALTERERALIAAVREKAYITGCGACGATRGVP